MAKPLKPGDQAPDFELLSEQNRPIRLSQVAKQQPYLVLYFYPSDNTPGCIVEGLGFRDHYTSFQKLGAQVLGIAHNRVAQHRVFKRRYRLPYPLLSDPGRKVAAAYGAATLFGLYTRRITYVLDQNGRVLGRFALLKHPSQHIQSALHLLEKLTNQALSKR